MSVSTVTESQSRLHLEDLSIHHSTGRQRQFAASPYVNWKHPLDFLVAGMLILPALPLIGILVLLVRATSPGPGMFRQIRVGRNGATFKMYKIRTMRCDAEAVGGAQWSTGALDPRVTRVGKVIRKLHLDEFPQLWNVLRGDMSLVGPRPERPEFVDVLSRAIPGYARRHVTRPGITGLAQINLPPDSDLESAKRKLELDVDYIEHAGLALDLRLLACTMLRLFGVRGNLLLKITGVRRTTADHDVPTTVTGPACENPLTPDLVVRHPKAGAMNGASVNSFDIEVGQPVTSSFASARKPR